MILPRNGRIAIIDDKFEEQAFPLLKTLYKNGFSAMYFSGEQAELPTQPLSDVRTIFLDMELIEATDDNSKAAFTANTLSHVVDISGYYFYFIILWATHSELTSIFWRYINENPECKCNFITIELDKALCAANDYDITFIESEITQKLHSNKGYLFLANWENVINKSSNDSICELLSLLENDSDINKKLLRIIKNLAIAYAGGHANDSTGHIVKNAMLAFNSVFKDSLESNTMKVLDDGFDFSNIGKIKDKAIKAGINSKLLLYSNSLNPKPGNVYLEINDDLHTELCFDIVKDNNNQEVVKANSQLISCEVSPFCDYSQNKWKVGRLIIGLFVVHEHINKIKEAGFLYKSPLLQYDHKIGYFVFDLRRAETKKLGRWRKKIITSMRHDLVIDLQHKISTHCSRPGMLSL